MNLRNARRPLRASAATYSTWCSTVAGKRVVLDAVAITHGQEIVDTIFNRLSRKHRAGKSASATRGEATAQRRNTDKPAIRSARWMRPDADDHRDGGSAHRALGAKVGAGPMLGHPSAGSCGRRRQGRAARIRSSRYPRTGMKSGIRSMGESAYPATQTARPSHTKACAGRVPRDTPHGVAPVARAHSLSRGHWVHPSALSAVTRVFDALWCESRGSSLAARLSPGGAQR